MEETNEVKQTQTQSGSYRPYTRRSNARPSDDRQVADRMIGDVKKTTLGSLDGDRDALNEILGVRIIPDVENFSKGNLVRVDLTSVVNSTDEENPYVVGIGTAAINPNTGQPSLEQEAEVFVTPTRLAPHYARGFYNETEMQKERREMNFAIHNAKYRLMVTDLLDNGGFDGAKWLQASHMFPAIMKLPDGSAKTVVFIAASHIFTESGIGMLNHSRQSVMDSLEMGDSSDDAVPAGWEDEYEG